MARASRFGHGGSSDAENDRLMSDNERGGEKTIRWIRCCFQDNASSAFLAPFLNKTVSSVVVLAMI